MGWVGVNNYFVYVDFEFLYKGGYLVKFDFLGLKFRRRGLSMELRYRNYGLW